MFPVA